MVDKGSICPLSEKSIFWMKFEWREFPEIVIDSCSIINLFIDLVQKLRELCFLWRHPHRRLRRSFSRESRKGITPSAQCYVSWTSAPPGFKRKFKRGLSFPRKLSPCTVDNYPGKELHTNPNLGNKINSYTYIFTYLAFSSILLFEEVLLQDIICKLTGGKIQTSSLPWVKGRLRAVNEKVLIFFKGVIREAFGVLLPIYTKQYLLSASTFMLH